ncbi:hypothetical protein T190115A13A_300005 [Tenacibaculum sp. 190524A02b]|uniref:Uncharacterized protein n=1 Tax=Tenacibaculum vairaonense TaxID=3137860 RepID=A0ABP1FDZ6_9FLAO
MGFLIENIRKDDNIFVKMKQKIMFLSFKNERDCKNSLFSLKIQFSQLRQL